LFSYQNDILILLIFQSLKIIRITIFIKIKCFTFTAFADAAIAPIDFPTAPAYAVPKVKYIVWKMGSPTQTCFLRVPSMDQT
jgi:hypothetical protein